MISEHLHMFYLVKFKIEHFTVLFLSIHFVDTYN